MERRWVRRLRVASGMALLAVAVVTALATALELRGSFSFCDPTLLVLCAYPGLHLPPPPDWTPVVALAAVGVVLLWPRRRGAHRPG